MNLEFNLKQYGPLIIEQLPLPDTKSTKELLQFDIVIELGKSYNLSLSLAEGWLQFDIVMGFELVFH